MGIDLAHLRLLLLLVIVLLVADFSCADDTKVNLNDKDHPDPSLKPNNSSNEKAGEVNLGVKDDGGKKENKPKEKDEGVVEEPKKGGGVNDGERKDLNVQVGDKETGKSNEGNARESGNEKLNGGKETKQEQVELKKEQGGKEISHGEECDPSNKCLIQDSNLVACIRVPGNDSPDLLLLIQNDGEVPVSVTILSPDFVQLEKKSIQLQQKEHKKVKVSINGKGRESSIVLKTGTSSSCSLDISDLIDDHHSGSGSIDNARGSTTYTTSNLPLFLACFVGLSIVAGITISRRRKLSKNGSSSSSNYQRLDMDLPVSGVGNKLANQTDDGWDNSWGDGWDDDNDGGDEEMPKTPSAMPVTPSLSSKGLASRSRLSKDGWKD
ncbi:hypothetical protein LINGRAHAP2_LOCUS3053 [Linum grandiflorum]